ncbi:hypothetical protein KM043_003556 [Ampulex compressa]|nr:hypothetical protein KM043_003556 [Ampulex compressa]
MIKTEDTPHPRMARDPRPANRAMDFQMKPSKWQGFPKCMDKAPEDRSASGGTSYEARSSRSGYPRWRGQGDVEGGGEKRSREVDPRAKKGAKEEERPAGRAGRGWRENLEFVRWSQGQRIEAPP